MSEQKVKVDPKVGAAIHAKILREKGLIAEAEAVEAKAKEKANGTK